MMAPDDQPITTVSIKEAAQRLGCSEATVRRKIARGELKAYKMPTLIGHGYTWRIQLDAPADDQSIIIDAQAVTTDDDQPITTSLALTERIALAYEKILHELERHNALREQDQAQIQALIEQNKRVLEEIRQEREAERLPWWRRWFRW